MHLLTGGSILSEKLIQLINAHNHVAIAVAWASAGTEVFKLLKKHQNKIRWAIIGTHFYQTHPDVLENFIGCDKVRFILQPQGVFHPKVYLFWTAARWDILIGSANLTTGALRKNSELMLHLSSEDTDTDIESQLQVQIKEYWNKGEVITEESALKYRKLWKLQQAALKRVSGEYSNDTQSKSPIHSEIMSMSWTSFFNAAQADPYHGFNERCDLLDLVREEFRRIGHFADMEIGVRKTIAGLPNDFNEHWGWFGSMRGAGKFHRVVNDNNPHLSAALDLIPMDGALDRVHFDSYVDEFKEAFPDGGDGVGLASRLLALKRPDYFVCLDAKNRTQLCKGFGIKQAGMTYDRYWNDIVCRVLDSVWWNEPRPNDPIAIRVWMGRAAMLDAIFYEE